METWSRETQVMMQVNVPSLGSRALWPTSDGQVVAEDEGLSLVVFEQVMFFVRDVFECAVIVTFHFPLSCHVDGFRGHLNLRSNATSQEIMVCSTASVTAVSLSSFY